MVLKNLTTGKIICQDLKIAEFFWDNLFGLLNPKSPSCLLLKTRFGLHTFFLKEPIDIVVLDQNMKVVKIKQNLKPNRLFFWNPKYSMLLELPKGQKMISLDHKLKIY